MPARSTRSWSATISAAATPPFTLSGRLAATVPLPANAFVKSLVASLNVSNITGKRAATSLSIGAASGTYNYFPQPPRQFFGTLSFGL